VLFDVETRRMAQKRRAAESAGARREQRRRQKGREGCRHAQKGRVERRPELITLVIEWASVSLHWRVLLARYLDLTN